jgi:hypothetical protein
MTLEKIEEKKEKRKEKTIRLLIEKKRKEFWRNVSVDKRPFFHNLKEYKFNICWDMKFRDYYYQKTFLSLIKDFIVLEKKKTISDEETIIKKSMQEFFDYEITDVYYGKKTKNIFLKLGRPGIFIGKGGDNINAITNYIQDNLPSIPIKQIRIIEDIEKESFNLYKESVRRRIKFLNY